MESIIDGIQSAHWALESCSAIAIAFAILIGIVELLPSLCGGRRVDVDFLLDNVGRNVALGLDLLLAATILTDTVAPDRDAIARLALLAVLRTILCLLLAPRRAPESAGDGLCGETI